VIITKKLPRKHLLNVFVTLFAKKYSRVRYDSLGTHTGGVPKIFFIDNPLYCAKHNKDRILQ